MATRACRLCHRERKLCDSHIIPAFVGRWLVRTSLTGRIRFTDAPNRAVQGLPTRPWFCENCERVLQRSEDYTNDHVFIPLHDRGQDKFRYGPGLPHFAASVSWRVLMMLKDDVHLGTLANAADQVDEALETWRRFVLGEVNSVGQYEQHVLLLDAVAEARIGRQPPRMLNRFIKRSIAIKPYYFRNAGYVITKLCRMLLVGSIVNTERREWNGTKIHARGGALGERRYHVPGWVLPYLCVGAEKMAGMAISSRQQERVRELMNRAITRDPDAAAGSQSLRAFEDDLNLSGPDVFAIDDEPGDVDA